MCGGGVKTGALRRGLCFEERGFSRLIRFIWEVRFWFQNEVG